MGLGMPEMSVMDKAGGRKEYFGNAPVCAPCLPLNKFSGTNTDGKCICIGFGRLGRADMHLHDGIERERHDGIVSIVLLVHATRNRSDNHRCKQYPHKKSVHGRSLYACEGYHPFTGFVAGFVAPAGERN